jgi:hypothetical protein
MNAQFERTWKQTAVEYYKAGILSQHMLATTEAINETSQREYAVFWLVLAPETSPT